MPFKEDVFKTQLETLYPFFVENPWTKALADKKVLVVHPFEDAIKNQYLKKELLFQNKNF